MPILIQCPSCTQKMQAPDTAVGKMVRCPSCRAMLKVPAPIPVATIAPEVVAEKPPIPVATPAPAEDSPSPDESTGITETPPAPTSTRPVWDKGEAEETAITETVDTYGLGKDKPTEPEPEPEYADEEAPRRRKKKRRRDDDDDDDDDYSPRTRRGEPHRGVPILVLGIVAIVASVICPLLCWILAAIAINMANEDNPKMERALMDPEGKGMTTGGLVCAYVAVLLGLINCVAGAILFTGM